jgi:hypothetical protein
MSRVVFHSQKILVVKKRFSPLTEKSIAQLISTVSLDTIENYPEFNRKQK